MTDPPRSLLAIDAGLRAGLAVYGTDGRLQSYRSTNFGSLARLKSGVYAVLNGTPGVEHVVVEGGGTVADPWLRECRRRNLGVRQVHAGIWREALILPRDRRTGADAKGQADVLARRVIDWSGAARPTSLRHDAAEAILLGLWGVVTLGWLPELPALLRPG